MKAMVRCVLVLMVLFIAAPGFAGEAVHMWACEMDDDATEEQVEAQAAEWLAAAKKVKGGENFKAYVYFPVAVNATVEMDLMFVVVAPSFAEWGTFWDNYGGSEAAKLEDLHHKTVICPDSVLWEGYKIK
jgi:hypothetical protein